jgi:hypothetical protein
VIRLHRVLLQIVNVPATQRNETTCDLNTGSCGAMLLHAAIGNSSRKNAGTVRAPLYASGGQDRGGQCGAGCMADAAVPVRDGKLLDFKGEKRYKMWPQENVQPAGAVARR